MSVSHRVDSAITTQDLQPNDKFTLKLSDFEWCDKAIFFTIHQIKVEIQNFSF